MSASVLQLDSLLLLEMSRGAAELVNVDGAGRTVAARGGGLGERLVGINRRSSLKTSPELVRDHELWMTHQFLAQ